MAPSPRRHTAAAMLLLSLFLFSVVSHAVKEAAAASFRSQIELQDHHQLDEEATSLTTMEEPCGSAGGGGEGEDEECLMRRTLVAHTDYIYTQGGHN